jgi:hypothetical protein
MKKLVLLMLSAMVLLATKAQEPPVVFSTEGNEVWYYLQFTRRVNDGDIYKAVQDTGTGNPLKQGKGKLDNPAHKWKFVGTEDSFKVISGLGNELSNAFNQEGHDADEDYFGQAITVASGEGKAFYFLHPTPSVWILGAKEYENNTTDWSYGGFLNDDGGIRVCIYSYMNDGSDNGDELIFVKEEDFVEEELPDSPVVFSPAEDNVLADENGNVWYYIQFQRSIQYDEEGNFIKNLTIEDYGLDEDIHQVEKTGDNYQWWKFVGNMEQFHIESHDGNLFSFRTNVDEEGVSSRRIYSAYANPNQYELVENPEFGWQIADVSLTQNRFLNDENNAYVTTYIPDDEGNYLVFTPVKITTSLPALSVKKATIYPNPAKEYVNVAITPTTTAIAILNSLGQAVIEVKPVGKTVEKINISTLDAGIYFLTIENGADLKTAKLLVK